MSLPVAQLVEALHYKPEGRGFDSRLGFFINIIFPGLAKPLTEMSTNNFYWGEGGKGRRCWG
jgi:hypothetical protein